MYDDLIIAKRSSTIISNLSVFNYACNASQHRKFNLSIAQGNRKGACGTHRTDTEDDPMSPMKTLFPGSLCIRTS